MPKQIPKVGDIFRIPLEDGTTCIGQVLETEPILMNSITCAFFDFRFNENEEIPDLSLSEEVVISCQFVTRELFNRGIWKRIGNVRPTIQEKSLPYRETKENGWIGAKILGAGNIRSFLNAYYGLRNWEEMKDPMYYDNLLFQGRKRSI